MTDEYGIDEDPRMPQVRAQVIKLAESPATTAAIQNIDEDKQFFDQQNAIHPPYDPKAMVVLYEHSNALRQNVDAYAVNIDGFGHSFKAVIDLEADSTLDEVRTLIALERQTTQGKEQVDEPTDAEVEERIKQLANEQRRESFQLNMFFSDCAETSFVDLRRRMRGDLEITGNGYWEVLRDARNRIAQFVYVEGFTVRLTPLDAESTEYDHKRRTITYDFETVKRKKRFRRFIQKVGSAAVYFKELGDPRCISASTGVAFKDRDAMRKVEENAVPATEMIHFKIPSARTAYGVPRWMGNLLSVMGSRQSEEVNFNYFENKSVPPLAILVSGGRLSSDSVKKLESFIETEVRGKQNFHKILLIEAESAEANEFENSGRMKIEMKPLTEAQNSDALFQAYDERNIDKVGMSFRVPRMLRGDTRDFNRSCYSEDTETLTENGWKRYDQIADGEKVAAFNKETGEVVFVVPAQKLVYDVQDELMVRFENANVDVLVTRDHRMLLRRKKNGPWEVHQAAEIPCGAYWFANAQLGYNEMSLRAEVTLCADDYYVEARTDVSRERYTGKVYCFSVPKFGFFVTRRNGKIAIQGNTAAAALDFAERQVFEPERMSFDYLINRWVLPDLGIKHWEFKSNSPAQRDPESLAKMIHDLQDFMTPNILMELAQGCFNRNFPRINEPWADMPLKLVLATANMGGDQGVDVPAGTPEAEDTDPDNQAPGNEPEKSNLEASDNKDQQRSPDGKFGGPAKGKKKPKARAQPARKGLDSIQELAGQLVDLRGRLATALVTTGVERADSARRADNDQGTREPLCRYQSDDDPTGT
jgi:PBSX family phage portal protein